MRVRAGFTLVEVTLATLLFTIGALGLVATASAIAKQLGASSLRSQSALIARSRAENATTSSCVVPGSGVEETSAIRSEWTISGNPVATLHQQLHRSDAFGLHRDRFISAAPCD